MAITLTEAPKRALYLIEHRLRVHHLYTAVPEDTDERIDIALPHEVYCLSANDIQGEANDLGKAVATGWRYLALHRDNVAAAVEVSGVTPQTMRFSHVNRGDFVQGTVTALEIAEKDDIVQKHDFEIRLLNINSLYFVSLWLHSPYEDRVIPLEPAPKGLKPNTLYTPTELFARLAPLARERRPLAEPVSVR